MNTIPTEPEKDITIFVACYNEECGILDTLHNVTSALTEVGCSWEIIVIDDCSEDKSVQLVERYIKDHPEYDITLKVREENMGLAQNYIEGAFLGNGKHYKLVCGDNVETKENMVMLFRYMGRVDMILQYFNKIEGKSLLRNIISKIYTIIVNMISGYRIRYYNGVGIFLRYDVMRWHTNYYGFSFQADIITRLLDNGASYLEVLGTGQERRFGKSTALTMKNFLSVTHFCLDLFIRRIGRMYRRRKKKNVT